MAGLDPAIYAFDPRRRFAPLLRDDDLFRSARVGEWGWCLCWSDDMEISSDTL